MATAVTQCTACTEAAVAMAAHMVEAIPTPVVEEATTGGEATRRPLLGRPIPMYDLKLNCSSRSTIVVQPSLMLSSYK